MSLGATPAHAASKEQTTSHFSRTTTPKCQSLGNQIDAIDINNDEGFKIGELDIYYNSSNGYNCAYTRRTADMAAKSMDMQVTISSCQETTAGGGCTATNTVTDDGMYSEYAGPVGVYAKGHCIAATGVIDGGNRTTTDYKNHPYANYCH